MPTAKFGTRQEANELRNRLSQYLDPRDDRRSTTVRLAPGAPPAVVERAENEALESQASRGKGKTGQIPLSRNERQRIDFTQPGVNVPKVRAIKGAARAAGVDDFLSFADLSLTVDENRALLQEATREDRGRRFDEGPSATERAGRAFTRQQSQQLRSAKGPAFAGDPEARGFIRELEELGDDPFEISFREGPFGRVEGFGEDFERLLDAHERRSPRAQQLDEIRMAPRTRDPFKWLDDPTHWDFPGIDTIDPQAFHAARSPRARAVDERRQATPAPSVDAWASDPGRFDLPGIDGIDGAFDDMAREIDSGFGGVGGDLDKEFDSMFDDLDRMF